ncbi:hypothetical protein [Streptomyces sp. C184]
MTVTRSPVVEGFGAETTVVVVAALLTVWVPVPLDAVKPASPL